MEINNLPCIVIRWDPDQKTVPAVQFDRDQFKNPLFAVAVIDMARTLLDEERKRLALAQVMNQMQQEQLNEKVRRQLHLG